MINALIGFPGVLPGGNLFKVLIFIFAGNNYLLLNDAADHVDYLPQKGLV